MENRGILLIANIRDQLSKLQDAYEIQAHEWEDYKCRSVVKDMKDDLEKVEKLLEQLVKRYC